MTNPVHTLLDKVWDHIIATHPLIRTEDLEKWLASYAQRHWVFDLENPDSDDAPETSVSVCVMISLLREIIEYRKTFGLLEPQSDYVFSQEEGETHEQAPPERRTGDRKTGNREQGTGNHERDRENPCRQPYPIPEEGRHPRSRH